MKTKLGILTSGLSVILLTVPLVAHHGYEVEYDPTKPVEGTGVISKVEWTNPHMRVYVDVTDDKGVVTTWNLEMGSPNSVVRRGWSRRDLQIGEKISFKAFSGRKVSTRAVADAIILADGRTFAGASGAPNR
jgi:hypothetical protein